MYHKISTLRPGIIRAASAGVETQGITPCAVTVITEAGADISGHQSKHVDEFKGEDFDAVIALCGHAHETLPGSLDLAA